MATWRAIKPNLLSNVPHPLCKGSKVPDQFEMMWMPQGDATIQTLREINGGPMYTKHK